MRRNCSTVGSGRRQLFELVGIYSQRVQHEWSHVGIQRIVTRWYAFFIAPTGFLIHGLFLIILRLLYNQTFVVHLCPSLRAFVCS
ncbi:hypothetical protein B0H12DRAFT_1114604 [Mycena haematopus]|nr:hypothetical protein B0H12DRAFT_1114604 [Mycena haematopus]